MWPVRIRVSALRRATWASPQRPPTQPPGEHLEECEAEGGRAAAPPESAQDTPRRSSSRAPMPCAPPAESCRRSPTRVSVGHSFLGARPVSRCCAYTRGLKHVSARLQGKAWFCSSCPGHTLVPS